MLAKDKNVAMSDVSTYFLRLRPFGSKVVFNRNVVVTEKGKTLFGYASMITILLINFLYIS